MNNKKLVRKRSDRMFLGVAAGLADYLNIDPVLIRLLFVLMALTGGHGILVYFVMAIIMPEEDTGPVAAKANAFDEEEIKIREA